MRIYSLNKTREKINFRESKYNALFALFQSQSDILLCVLTRIYVHDTVFHVSLKSKQSSKMWFVSGR